MSAPPARRNGDDERMRIMRRLAGSRLSRAYLAVVAVVTLLSWWEHLAWLRRADEVAGTYPILATAPPLILTAPTSLLLEWWTPADRAGQWSFTVSVLAGALVNAAALNGLRTALRRRRRPRPE